MFAASWCHDGAAKGPKKIAWSNNWVIAGLVVTLPCMTRPVCLPILFRLWRSKGPTKLVLARQLAETIAEHFAGRQINVVADAWTVLAVLAHNLGRWTLAAVGGHWAGSTVGTLRRKLVRCSGFCGGWVVGITVV